MYHTTQDGVSKVAEFTGVSFITNEYAAELQNLNGDSIV